MIDPQLHVHSQQHPQSPSAFLARTFLHRPLFLLSVFSRPFKNTLSPTVSICRFFPGPLSSRHLQRSFSPSPISNYFFCFCLSLLFFSSGPLSPTFIMPFQCFPIIPYLVVVSPMALFHCPSPANPYLFNLFFIQGLFSRFLRALFFHSNSLSFLPHHSVFLCVIIYVTFGVISSGLPQP